MKIKDIGMKTIWHDNENLMPSIRLVQSSDGFSIIELMVSVGIISILVTMAQAPMRLFLAKAKRVDAIQTLHHIQILQETYKADNGHYWPDVAQDGLSSKIEMLSTGNIGSANSCNVPNGLGFTISDCRGARYWYQLTVWSGGYYHVHAYEVNKLVFSWCTGVDQLTVRVTSPGVIYGNFWSNPHDPPGSPPPGCT
jgi:prepilin-type N-terminal cleavage/methylation domain-containing protein